MARLIGPDEASRKAETIDSSGRFAAKRNRPATVYSDAAATQLADVLWLDGTPVPGSVITIDAYSMLPLFQFPDGADTVWVVVDGGPAWPMYARADDRLDALGGRVGTVEGVAAASAQRAANLSDLANAATARTNLGLGSVATSNVGTTAGTVAAGDDSRITGLTYGPATSLPAGLGWTLYTSITPKLAYTPTGKVGAVGITPEALFDASSTARTSPGATYYVTTTGSDSNNGLTSGTAYASIQKAIQSANAAAVPTRVVVAAGVYPRTKSFYASSITPTVDIAIVAVGGRVNTGTYDLLTIPAPDATFTNTYSQAVANCDRVVDTARLNEFGNYVEYVQVATAAACNTVAGTWALVAGTIYIHRLDETAVTATNTRVFRSVAFGFLVDTPRHVYLGGEGTGSGFDLEGSAGSAVARFDMGSAGASASPKTVILADSTFCYGGGVIGVAAVGVATSRWNGLLGAFNCRASANSTDGWNAHNAAPGAPNPQMLLVNCAGHDNGRGTAQSCNGFTLHETCIGIDVAGDYRGNRGGTVRSINNSRTYLLGTYTANDRGDLGAGGLVPSTGVRVDDSAELWAEAVTIAQPRGAYAWVANASTSAIHRRGCPLVPQPDSGSGSFDAF